MEESKDAIIKRALERVSGEEIIKDLIAKSKDAKERAFAPYSKFKVGAALLTVDGRIFTGKKE